MAVQRFGATVLERREAAGLSRLDLARRAGISHSGIRFIEDGVIADPRLSTALKLARALNISPAELADGVPA